MCLKALKKTQGFKCCCGLRVRGEFVVFLCSGVDGTELHSLFVGDIALEVTDLLLQTYFQQFFQSVNSAKVGSS